MANQQNTADRHDTGSSARPSKSIAAASSIHLGQIRAVTLMVVARCILPSHQFHRIDNLFVYCHYSDNRGSMQKHTRNLKRTRFVNHQTKKGEELSNRSKVKIKGYTHRTVQENGGLSKMIGFSRHLQHRHRLRRPLLHLCFVVEPHRPCSFSNGGLP